MEQKILNIPKLYPNLIRAIHMAKKTKEISRGEAKY